MSLRWIAATLVPAQLEHAVAALRGTFSLGPSSRMGRHRDESSRRDDRRARLIQIFVRSAS